MVKKVLIDTFRAQRESERERKERERVKEREKEEEKGTSLDIRTYPSLPQ